MPCLSGQTSRRFSRSRAAISAGRMSGRAIGCSTRIGLPPAGPMSITGTGVPSCAARLNSRRAPRHEARDAIPARCGRSRAPAGRTNRSRARNQRRGDLPPRWWRGRRPRRRRATAGTAACAFRRCARHGGPRPSGRSRRDAAAAGGAARRAGEGRESSRPERRRGRHR